jgi:hypothetical protein
MKKPQQQQEGDNNNNAAVATAVVIIIRRIVGESAVRTDVTTWMMPSIKDNHLLQYW